MAAPSKSQVRYNYQQRNAPELEERQNGELLIINCLRLEDHRKQFHYLAGRVPTSYRSEVNVFRTLGNPRPTAARQPRLAFTRNARAVCPNGLANDDKHQSRFRAADRRSPKST